ncbi:hypothetical protein Shal_1786 [Shewanella halifaxensis HAW-EB4]|uniref:Uncharacterized protein n=1 Tax=Shewanella halifaxensis (strain HAW-EB4) TaxID=458817 RepID=B0TQV6_SHEHH|nr:hypothetical protein [Shewanella halifaxensis]ABZ76351.1 hypothetical protein Shal_1786 [Shewanella halifaxensis HAW-EB4]
MDIQSKCKLVLLSSVFLTSIQTSAVAQPWEFSSTVDDFADTSISIASTKTSDGKGMAFVRCNAKTKLEIVFADGQYMGTGKSLSVRYRIDKDEVVNQRWRPSTEGTSLFVGSSGKYPLARNLANGEKIIIEVKDYKGTPHKFSFALTGAKEPIRQVFDKCGIPFELPQIDGVKPDTMDYVNNFGPNSTSCTKQMLNTLGYRSADISEVKTDALYVALQNYINDKSKVCDGKTRTFETVFCSDPVGFASSLYGDAVKLDKTYKKTCSKRD